MGKLQASLVIVLFVLVTANLARDGITSSLAAPSGLALNVNSSLADATDIAPGDGVCETGPGNATCTLRAAIMEANASPGQDTIHVPSGTFTLTRIGYDNSAVNGDLDILDDLILQGVSYDDTFIDGNGVVTQGRVFHIHPDVKVKIAGVRILHGFGPESSAEDTGAGIYNQGELVLEAVSVRENTAMMTGGILNTGSLQIKDSFITNNTGANGSGGLFSNGTAIIDKTLFMQNVSGEQAGGIGNSGGLTITRSMLNANNAGFGAAIFNDGTILMQDSAITNNTTDGAGGGLFLHTGSLTLINSTISGNKAESDGGGIYISTVTPAVQAYLYNVTMSGNWADSDHNDIGSGGGIMTNNGILSMQNTILANNLDINAVVHTPDDCKGTLNSTGYNLVETTTGCTLSGTNTGNKTGLDPLLGSLGNNGGATWTHALQAGSPAIDAGNVNGCGDHLGALLFLDQATHLRHFDGDNNGSQRCDMGAAEYNSPVPWANYLPVLLK